MSAADVARSAYDQALRAAQVEKERREAEARAEAERTRALHQRKFDAALSTLNAWFPSVEWTWEASGSYGYDTICWDASENYPPSFLLKIETYNGLKLKVGEYRVDSQGYTYFTGEEVKSAADIGRYLAGKNS